MDPAAYGERNEGLSRRTDPEADAFELALATAARSLEIPTLAICRGMQIVNVALGGTLRQDIPATGVAHQDADPGAAGLPVTYHRVSIPDPSCLLSGLYGPEATVNSIHHQSLARVAEELTVVAMAEDGVVEGVESSGGEWPLIGVQWHPEKATDGAPLFRWLVDSATLFRKQNAALLESSAP
ncbi:peptidase C26 family protein [Arthrobacter globiformis NBRC 12137]|uniref:Peptidase C26 family protein n=1 Tax=Arthrobacter globiformis (strain ATCC 8010 / DSM 20124 / JCM 1332 / NBRC 12137 / NCIMB 8907 / NRRL B-2979 / 168) TaxID=1077972 RepID=H0QK47_ARTG1|nr:peptidase C26 family protein [Arthrobacter globiformis NBRC 12137]